MNHWFRYTWIVALVLLAITRAGAQDKKNTNFPIPFGPTNVGTEFWLSFPSNWDRSIDEKYVRLYITSGVATQVDIHAGSKFLGTVTTVPYGIVTFDLNVYDAQTVVRDDDAPIPNDRVYTNRGIHIESKAPIVVYGVNRTKETTDGMLAIPVSSLGNEYIVASAAAVTADVGQQELPSQFVITAPYDNTQVNILNTWDTPNHTSGQFISITLMKGDVYSAMSLGFGGDLSGTRIICNKPVAVTAGQNCTFLPDRFFQACDHLVEMLTPVSSWGTVYQSVPYKNRKKGDLYRIFASEPGTDIIVNGQKIATLSEVGGQKGGGWIEYLPPDKDLKQFSSNKPIFVAQYNNSHQYDDVPTDPFYSILTPLEQYQTQFVCSTPGADFADNYINVVCDSATLWEIEIEKNGSGTWERILDKYNLQYQKFPVKTNGVQYVGKSFRIDPGVYRLRAEKPFAGYIYGTDDFDSYGYPLSVAVADLNSPDEDPPVTSGEPDCNGFVEILVTDMPEDQSIRSNLNTVWLEPDSSFNYELDVPKFVNGIDRTVTYQLQVIDPTQDARAIVIISDMAGNTTIDTVLYAASHITMEPGLLAFGSVNAGEQEQLPITIRNDGSGPIDVQELVLQLGDQGFTIAEPIGEFTIEPGSEIEATISFSSSVAGSHADSLGLTDDCGTRYMVLLTANVGSPIINVSDWDFGNIVVGTPSTWRITISNPSTNGRLVVTDAQGPFTAVYTLPNGLPGFPLELDPGESEQLNVTFTPAAEQYYLDSIVFEHNAPDNPANDPTGILEGRGIAASLIATSYAWDAYRVGTGPYNASVWLKNLGNSSATVQGLVAGSPSGDVNDFQILNPNDFANVAIPTGDSVEVLVSFSPTDIGEREMRITYNAIDQENNPVSILTGIGLRSGLGTDDLDFGQMVVGDPEVNRTVDFYLIGDPLYRDEVTITGFEFVSDNAGGVDDFRYDEPAGGFPIVLSPGGTDRVTITGYFSAQAAGQRNASLRAITADNVDTTSFWVGRGTLTPLPDISVSDIALDLCITEPDTVEVVIQSIGSTPLSISDLRLEGEASAFEILDPITNPPLDIPAGESHTVRIAVTPAEAGELDAMLIIESNASSGAETEVNITGTVTSIVLEPYAQLSGTKEGKAELGNSLPATIRIDEQLDAAAITGYTVTLTYNPVDLVPPASNDVMSLGPTNPDGAVAEIDEEASSEGELVIRVTLPEPLTGSGVLLTVPFEILFNTNEDRTVGMDIDLEAGACVQYTSTGATIDIYPICGLTFRLIELTNSKFALEQNTPNPFNPVTTIPYSIGLDGPAQLLLYDSRGNLVQMLVDQFHQPGRYEILLDVSALPSGVYYYTLVSGDWTETRRMTVLK